MTSRDEHDAVWLATLNTSRTVLTTKTIKKMTRTQIATADFSCGGMQKGTNGDESDERLRTENSYIDNRHKHTIIATLSVKKGSKFTDPDAQFPRGGALACARGLRTTSGSLHNISWARGSWRPKCCGLRLYFPRLVCLSQTIYSNFLT